MHYCTVTLYKQARFSIVILDCHYIFILMETFSFPAILLLLLLFCCVWYHTQQWPGPLPVFAFRVYPALTQGTICVPESVPKLNFYKASAVLSLQL